MAGDVISVQWMRVSVGAAVWACQRAIWEERGPFPITLHEQLWLCSCHLPTSLLTQFSLFFNQALIIYLFEYFYIIDILHKVKCCFRLCIHQVVEFRRDLQLWLVDC